MAQTTEAACLLHSGTMYPRRVGLRGSRSDDVLAGVKAGGFSLYFGDEPIYHFDLEGRWQRAYVDGMHYLKGLDATVRAVGRGREAGSLVLRRRTLSPGEAGDLDDRARSAALGLIADLDAGRLELSAPPPTARAIEPDELRELLGRVAAWDAAAWSGHRDRYAATYGPWPSLPPDCPNPVVLQATRARSPEEFETHVRDVAGLLGRRRAQCRGVFLDGPDVLRRPEREILAHLGTIRSVFPDAAGVDSVHAYLDDFRPPLPDRDGWARRKAAGLGRVTLGVESGDPSARDSSGKTWTDNDLREAIAVMKAAGIGLGLVVRAGSGATAGLVGSLGLGGGDLVFVIDGVGSADLVAALKARTAGGGGSKGPRVVAYNPDKQWA